MVSGRSILVIVLTVLIFLGSIIYGFSANQGGRGIYIRFIDESYRPLAGVEV